MHPVWILYLDEIFVDINLKGEGIIFGKILGDVICERSLIQEKMLISKK